jgi:RNA polymerase sigma factor (TIGR02999 family)
VRCQDRKHFIGIVGRLMNQVLIQAARRRRAAKRGSGRVTPFDEEATVADRPAASPAEALEEALTVLRRLHPRRHLMVEMHYRGGSTVQEVAEATAVSQRTVERELQCAREWLEHEIWGER